MKFFDGQVYSDEFQVKIEVLKFNEAPEIRASNMSQLALTEESFLTFPVSFVDYDSTHVTTVVVELPKNGKLVFVNSTTGEDVEIAEAFSQYNVYQGAIPFVQYASEVVDFSTEWVGNDGYWGSKQILGPPNNEGNYKGEQRGRRAKRRAEKALLQDIEVQH